jgi:hypothetical protein
MVVEYDLQRVHCVVLARSVSAAHLGSGYVRHGDILESAEVTSAANHLFIPHTQSSLVPEKTTVEQAFIPVGSACMPKTSLFAVCQCVCACVIDLIGVKEQGRLQLCLLCAAC